MAPDSTFSPSLLLQLLDQLVEYAEHVYTLADDWPPDELVCAQTNALLKLMGSEVMLVPALHTVWACFLISHAAWVRTARTEKDVGLRLDALEEHIGRLLDVEAVCLQIATRQQWVPS